MVDEGLFLLCKFLLLLWGKLSLVLILLNSDELVVADFNLFLKQVLDLDLG